MTRHIIAGQILCPQQITIRVQLGDKPEHAQHAHDIIVPRRCVDSITSRQIAACKHVAGLYNVWKSSGTGEILFDDVPNASGVQV